MPDKYLCGILSGILDLNMSSLNMTLTIVCVASRNKSSI